MDFTGLSDAKLITHLAWGVLALPFIASLIIALGLMWTRYARFSAWVSVAAILTSAFCSGVLLFGRVLDPSAPAVVDTIAWVNAGPLHLQMGVLVDNLAAVMLFVVTFIASLIQIYSTVYMEHELATDFARFFAYMSIFAASMLLLVLAPNFSQLYVGWELVGLCSYLLIGFWWFKKSAADANKKAFIVNRVGDAGMLLGILLLFNQTGALNFTGDHNALQAVWDGVHLTHAITPLIATIMAVLIFCGAIGKSAQFPLHIWLPDAMEGPTPVSALIHAATMVAAGVYLVARAFPIFMITQTSMMWVAGIGAFTSFMAATMGIAANDIKRVLAYSTCSQLGYMMLALGVGGLTAGTFHLVTHAFFKAMLFLCAGSVIHAMHTNDMWQMGGLGKYMKVTGATFLVGCLAISGIPPFSGFFSKDAIVEAAMDAHFDGPFGGVFHAFLTLAAVGVAVMTAYYMFRMYFATFCGEHRGFEPTHPISGESMAAQHEPHEAEKPVVHSDTEGHAAPPPEVAAHETQPHHGEAEHHQEEDPVSNYWHHELHRPEGTPRENPAFMIVPLIVLALFATCDGWIQIPGKTDFFHMLMDGSANFSYMTDGMAQGAAVPGVQEAATGFDWSVVATSTTAALLGIFLAWLGYGRNNAVATERSLRSRFPLIYRFLENRWYLDDLWAGIASVMMFDFGTAANWIDVNVINGAVNQVGYGVWEAGTNLREEQTGLVQQYATIVVIALLFFIIGVGIVGQDFLAPDAIKTILRPPLTY